MQNAKLEHYLVGPHALPHEVFIYIYILISKSFNIAARVLAAISVEIGGTQMWIEERLPIMQSIVNSKSFFFFSL